MVTCRGGLSYLVALHRFKHSETADVDDPNLMALAGSRIQIHQWHHMLTELRSCRVRGDVHDLRMERCSD